MDATELTQRVSKILDELDKNHKPAPPMLMRRRITITHVAKAIARGANYRDALGRSRPHGAISKRVFFDQKKPYWHNELVQGAIYAIAQIYGQHYAEEKEEIETAQRAAEAAERAAEAKRRKDRREGIIDSGLNVLQKALSKLEIEELKPSDIDRLIKNLFAQERVEFADLGEDGRAPEEIFMDAVREVAKGVDIHEEGNG